MIEEAIRLIHKFLPESKEYIFDFNTLNLELFCTAMKHAEHFSDFSCAPVEATDNTIFGFKQKGGFEGEESEIYQRILDFTGLKPEGRALVIPDTIRHKKDRTWPFVCDCAMVPTRLDEIQCTFELPNDSLFVFESGEAFFVDHDNRLFWAKSKINKTGL